MVHQATGVRLYIGLLRTIDASTSRPQLQGDHSTEGCFHPSDGDEIFLSWESIWLLRFPVCPLNENKCCKHKHNNRYR